MSPVRFVNAATETVLALRYHHQVDMVELSMMSPKLDAPLDKQWVELA